MAGVHRHSCFHFQRNGISLHSIYKRVRKITAIIDLSSFSGIASVFNVAKMRREWNVLLCPFTMCQGEESMSPRTFDEHVKSVHNVSFTSYLVFPIITLF